MRRRPLLLGAPWAVLAIGALASCSAPRPTPAYRPDWRALEHAEAARAAREESNFSTAERELREAIALDPQWIEARFALQDLQFSTLRRLDALEEAQALRTAAPKDPLALILEMRAQQGTARKRLAALIPWDKYLAPWIALVRAEDEDATPDERSAFATSSEEPRIREFWEGATSRHQVLMTLIQFRFNPSALSGYLGDPPSAIRAARLLDAAKDSLGYEPEAVADLTARLQPMFAEILQIPEGVHALETAVRDGMRERQRLVLERELQKLPLPDERERELRLARALLSAALHRVRNEPHMERLELEEAWRLGARSVQVLSPLRLAALRTGDGARAVAVHQEWTSRWGVTAKSPASLDALASALAEERSRPIAENSQIAAELALSAGWHEEALELAARAAIRSDLRMPSLVERILSPELLAARLGLSSTESRNGRPRLAARKPSITKLRTAIRSVAGSSTVAVSRDGWLGWTLRAPLGSSQSVIAGTKAWTSPAAFITSDLCSISIAGIGDVTIAKWEQLDGWGYSREVAPMAILDGHGSLDVKRLEALSNALERRAGVLSKIPVTPWDVRRLPEVSPEERNSKRIHFEVEWRLLQELSPQHTPAVAAEILARLSHARSQRLRQISQIPIPRALAMVQWSIAPSLAATLLSFAERDAWLTTLETSSTPRVVLAIAIDRTLQDSGELTHPAVAAALDLWMDQFQKWAEKRGDRFALDRPLLPQAALLTDAEVAAIARSASNLNSGKRHDSDH